MCGRFTLSSPAEIVAEMFELAEPPAIAPRYNIAPTQPVPVVRFGPGAHRRRFDFLHWGLIPAWAKDPSIGGRMINARCETAAQKPSFRAAMKRRRCLIVADGFYEWQKLASGKQPWCIRMADGRPFGFAGLWEQWTSSDGSEIESWTILTTQPNDVLKPVHDRMPVILDRKDHNAWLAPDAVSADVVAPLLRPFPSDLMTAYKVAAHVNRPANDDPTCAEPIDAR